jgi:hypothetical protein
LARPFRKLSITYTSWTWERVNSVATELSSNEKWTELQSWSCKQMISLILGEIEKKIKQGSRKERKVGKDNFCKR